MHAEENPEDVSVEQVCGNHMSWQPLIIFTVRGQASCFILFSLWKIRAYFDYGITF